MNLFAIPCIASALVRPCCVRVGNCWPLQQSPRVNECTMSMRSVLQVALGEVIILAHEAGLQTLKQHHADPKLTEIARLRHRLQTLGQPCRRRVLT